MTKINGPWVWIDGLVLLKAPRRLFASCIVNKRRRNDHVPLQSSPICQHGRLQIMARRLFRSHTCHGLLRSAIGNSLWLRSLNPTSCWVGAINGNWIRARRMLLMCRDADLPLHHSRPRKGDPAMPMSPTMIPSSAVFLCSALLAFGYAASATGAAPVKGDYFHTGAGARYLERAKGDIVTVPLRGNINVCPSSGDLRPIMHFEKGGSGSSGVRV